MNIAQSAASFVGTKSAPKSRKPAAAKPAAHNQKVMAALPSIVASLAAQIAEAPKAAPAPYNLTKCPKCGSDEIYTGRVVNGLVQDEQLVGGCHSCDWTYDVRSTKASKAPTMVVLTSKGAKFSPRGKSEVSKTKDQITWPKIVALFANSNEVSSADILAAIPEHRDYFGYALRSGWLAAA